MLEKLLRPPIQTQRLQPEQQTLVEKSQKAQQLQLQPQLRIVHKIIPVFLRY